MRLTPNPGEAFVFSYGDPKQITIDEFPFDLALTIPLHLKLNGEFVEKNSQQIDTLSLPIRALVIILVIQFIGYMVIGCQTLMKSLLIYHAYFVTIILITKLQKQSCSLRSGYLEVTRLVISTQTHRIPYSS